MDPKNILLVGVKGSVLAFQKNTGERLWATRLKSSMSSDFVSVAADDARVYAHTAGELFCLDLQTGNGLWQEGLAGMGYGVASLTLPGFPAAPTEEFEKKRQQDAAAATTHASSAS